MELLDGPGKIVLYDPDHGASADNLVKLDSQGRILWRAMPVGRAPDDHFVYVERHGGGIAANTWSGIRVSIDSETGRVFEPTFTK